MLTYLLSFSAVFYFKFLVLLALIQVAILSWVFGLVPKRYPYSEILQVMASMTALVMLLSIGMMVVKM